MKTRTRKVFSLLLTLVMVFSLLPVQALAVENAEAPAEEIVMDEPTSAEEPTPSDDPAPADDPDPAEEEVIAEAPAPDDAAQPAALPQTDDTQVSNLASGYCGAEGDEGTNVQWLLTDDGRLAITGTGAMKNYTLNSHPGWYPYRANITSVVIAEGVTSIGNYAFHGGDGTNYPNLTSATIVYSVESIGSYAFYNCKALADAALPATVTTLKAYAFAGTALTEVTIPAGVTTFENDVFRNCTSLQSVTLEYGLTILGMDAFLGCTALESVTIPNSVTTIRNSVFQDCTSLRDVTLAAGLTVLGSNMFIRCTSLESITLPNSITEVPYQAFAGCTALTEMEFSPWVTSLGASAFSGCTGLREIRFRGSAPTFGSNVFYNVTATAYYPSNYSGWNSDVMQNYGGTITWVTNYDLTVDGVPVTEQNKNDILGNGKFSFVSPYTLNIAGGTYSGTADVLIDGHLPTLIIQTDYATVLENASHADDAVIIRNTGDIRFGGNGELFLRCSLDYDGESTCGVETTGSYNVVSVGTEYFSLRNVACGLRAGGTGSSLRFVDTDAVLYTYGEAGAVVGFTGGVTLLDGSKYISPAYLTEQNGALGIDAPLGFTPWNNIEIGRNAYDLIINGTRVTPDNCSDITGDGVFAYDPDDQTLTLNGYYSPESLYPTQYDRCTPIIDSCIDGLTIVLAGDVRLDTRLENYITFVPAIRSAGDLKITAAAGLTQPVLLLTNLEDHHASFDGVHMDSGDLVLDNVDLQMNDGMYRPGRGLVGDGAASTVTFRNARADIRCLTDSYAPEGYVSAALSGFAGGVFFEGCGIVDDAVTIENGGAYADGTLSLELEVKTGLYNLVIEGYRLFDGDNLNKFWCSYDPDSNTLTLDMSRYGAADYVSDYMPLIENHIPGLTILIGDVGALGTSALRPGRGMIESDVDMTITSSEYESSVTPGLFSRRVLALNGGGKIISGILMKNGATLTLRDAEVRIFDTAYGLRGENGAAAEFINSAVEVQGADTAALTGFTGGVTLTDCTIQTPDGGLIQNGTAYEADGTTVAGDLSIFYAQYSDIWIDGHFVYSLNQDDITGDGSFAFDPETNTLTIKKSYSSGAYSTLIQIDRPGVTISVPADVTLTSTYGEAGSVLIHCGGDVTITGAGMLTLHGNGLSESCGLLQAGDGALVTLQNARMTVENVAYGVSGVNTTPQTLHVNDSTLESTATAAAVSRFNGGIVFSDDYGVIYPVNHRIGDDGTVCNQGGTPAVYVQIGLLPEVAVYTVSFDANGHGTAPEAQTVNNGETATRPADPTAEGWTFGGWYTDAECTTEYDFTTPVTADLTLYAKWTMVAYTVSFDVQGHGTAPEAQTVNHGAAAARPADPTAEGWTFGGWYTDAECTTEYDFTTPVTADLTLYAKWTMVVYTVSFNANGHGTAPEAQTVNHGATAARPADPSEEGWIFGGWYTDAECTMEYDFTTPVTADLTLYAKWTMVVYTVSFNANGHGTAPEAQTVNDGAAATRPADPSEEGWSFGGWYTDAECTTEYDFTTPVTADLTLYAKWTMVAYDLWLGETQVTYFNKADILGDGTASYDHATGTLTFTTETPNITGLHENALIYADGINLTINAPTAGLKLNASASAALIGSYKGRVTINGDIELTNSTGYGIHAERTITVNGSMTGICKTGMLQMNGGSIYSILVTGDVDVTMTGNNYTVINSSGDVVLQGTMNKVQAPNGARQSLIYSTGGSITIGGAAELTNNGGTFCLNAKTGITIPDGYVITTPTGGMVTTWGSRYTVTEADGTTVASHVVIGQYTEYPLWLGETRVNEENKADILGDGTASFDPATNTLTFTTETPNITGLHENALIWADGIDLTIERNGSLSLTGGDDAVRVNNGALQISAEGAASFLGTVYGANGVTVNAGGDITMTEGFFGSGTGDILVTSQTGKIYAYRESANVLAAGGAAGSHAVFTAATTIEFNKNYASEETAISFSGSVELTAPDGIRVRGSGSGFYAGDEILVNCANGAVTFEGYVYGADGVTVNAMGDITLTEGYFYSYKGDILVTTETGKIYAYRESANNLVSGGYAGYRAVFTAAKTIEFHKDNTVGNNVITFGGSVELTAPDGIQVLAGGGGSGIYSGNAITVNCANGAVTFDGYVYGRDGVTVNAKGDITLTEGYFYSYQGDILVTTETGKIHAYRESVNNLVSGGYEGYRAVFTAAKTIEFHKNNTVGNNVITFGGSVELRAPDGIQVLAGGGGSGIYAGDEITVNCANGAVTFDGYVYGSDGVTVNAKGDITLTEGYFSSYKGDILVTTETGRITAYRESSNNLVSGGYAGYSAVFTSPTTIEFNKDNTGGNNVINFDGSVELRAPDGIQVLTGGGYGIHAGVELVLESDATIEVTGRVQAGIGITIPATHAITTPTGGQITQITPESGDPYYTVTEADGTTDATHVVIEPAQTQPTAKVYGCSLSLDGDIGVNFYVVLPDEFINDPDAYITLNTTRLTLADATASTSGGQQLYKWKYRVVAKRMPEDVVLNVYNGAGEKLRLESFSSGEDFTESGYATSVSKYIQQTLATSTKVKLIALVKALSDYGSKAQMHFNHNTSAAAAIYNQAAIDAVTAETVEPFRYTKTQTEQAGVSFAALTLVLESETTLKLYFKLSEGVIGDYSFTLDGKAVTPTYSKGYYVVEIKDIAAKNLDKVYTVKVSDSSGVILTVNSCALSYVCQVMNLEGQSEKLLQVVKALYLYNQAANAYF